jgi:hypothetical protein
MKKLQIQGLGLQLGGKALPRVPKALSLISALQMKRKKEKNVSRDCKQKFSPFTQSDTYNLSHIFSQTITGP